MNKEKIELIIRNIELLVNSLKQELIEPGNKMTQEFLPYTDEYEPDYYEEED